MNYLYCFPIKNLEKNMIIPRINYLYLNLSYLVTQEIQFFFLEENLDEICLSYFINILMVNHLNLSISFQMVLIYFQMDMKLID